MSDDLTPPTMTPEMLDASLAEVTPSRSLAQDAWRRFRRNKLAMFGLFLVALLILVAIFGPLFVGDPLKLAKISREGPTSQHPFGIDQRGGDVLARVVYGIRLSMFIGIFATLLETIIGVAVGALAGWYGRWVDTVSMRFVDIMLGIPYIILAYAFITVLGRGVAAVVFTLALTAWLQTARRNDATPSLECRISSRPCRRIVRTYRRNCTVRR